MPQHDIDLINRLSAAIVGNERDGDACWTAFQLLDSSIACDPSATAYQRQKLARVREGVSEVISAWQAGQTPSTGSVIASLGALESSLVKGRPGADGWPR